MDGEDECKAIMLRQYSNTDRDKLLAFNEAVFRLSNNQDFKTFHEWLKLEKVRLSEENITAQDLKLKWNQGAIQALSDILAMSDREEAHKILEKLRK